MAGRNGSGVMSISYPDFVAGTTIDDSQVDTNFAEIVAEITNSIPRDGQAAPTADIPFGTNKITGLKSGTAATDAANLGQVQAQAYKWLGTAGGTADVITATTSPVISAYAAGQSFQFVASADNTGATTINLNSLGAKNIKKTASGSAADLAAGDIKAGSVVCVAYDGTQFRLMDSYIGVGSVTAAKLATDAVETAKIKDAAVTAAKLATDSVESAKIKDANVTAAKLATDSVETVKIKDAAVTSAKLASGAVTYVNGTTTNDNAASGVVGEYIESNVPIGSAVSLVSATAKNVTSISLTAGDWDVTGNVAFSQAASTTATAHACWISTTSATYPTLPNDSGITAINVSIPANALNILSAGTKRISVASTTTVYLSCQSTFAVSTEVAFGHIRARRVR